MKLLHGNCLDLMGRIPDGSVDMVLCDLPYGSTENKWDVKIPLESLWEEYKRVTKENAAIVLFAQRRFAVELAQSQLKLFHYEWIWKKSNVTGFLNANRAPLVAHEKILVFYRKMPTYNPQFTYGKPYRCKRHSASPNYRIKTRIPTVSEDGRRYPVDVLEFGNSNERSLHPTQKPVALLEYLIRTYSNEGETVLDNCMGSGSTGVACVNTGRDFIGIELEEEYFNAAKERIEGSVRQL